MASYIVTEPAESDLEEILLFIAEDNPDAALALNGRLTELFEMLTDFPKSGRERKELRRDARSFPEASYSIIYRIISPDQIEILRVLHSARDLEEIFS